MQITAQWPECVTPEQARQRGEHPPGCPLACQRIGFGNVAEQLTRQPPDERSRERIRVVRRDAVCSRERQVHLARHRRAGRDDDLGGERG